MHDTTTKTDDPTNTRELAFEVYPDGPEGEDDFFAVMTAPGPDVPRGTLDRIQAHVSDAVEDGRLTVDGPIEHAGDVCYEPEKDDGDVRYVTLRDEVTN